MLQPRVRLEAMTSSLAGVPSFQLSIIIPSFNEELRLPGSLELIAAYVNASNRSTEVLVVDDGSKDRTAEVAASFSDRIANLRVLKNGENRGKGYSVRHGMTEAGGENVLFTDADLSAPIEEADKLLLALQQYDIAIGSRALNRDLRRNCSIADLDLDRRRRLCALNRDLGRNRPIANFDIDLA